MMKNLKEYPKRYLMYIILFLIIIILFFCVSYENLNGYTDTIVSLRNEDTLLINDYCINEDNLYFSYDDIEKFFDTDVYIDKMTRKIIITSKDVIKKSELNSKISYTNFVQDESDDANYIKYNEKDYLLVENIADIYGLKVVYNEDLNKIWFVENAIQKVNLVHDRALGYIEKKVKNKRLLLTNRDDIYIVKNDMYYDNNSEYVMSLIKKDGKELILYVNKLDLNLVMEEKQVEEKKQVEFIELFVNEENLDFNNETNSIILSGFRLLNKSGDVINTYNKELINKAEKYNMQCFVSLTNGYKMSNYDNSISVTVLQSEQIRERIIKQIAEEITLNTIDGIVLDFREIHQNCKADYSQFIKEISAYLHAKDKKVLVYIPNEATYIDLKIVNDYADYGILVQYGTKTQTSKTSGTHSSVKLVETNLNELKNRGYNLNKYILEIPLYSILWTEKNNKVINTEIYYYSALNSYILNNNLVPQIDESTSQKYVEHIKGSLKYKMWLEDEFSIKQKRDLAKTYELGGISLYKKGYDSSFLLDKIK